MTGEPGLRARCYRYRWLLSFDRGTFCRGYCWLRCASLVESLQLDKEEDEAAKTLSQPTAKN